MSPKSASRRPTRQPIRAARPGSEASSRPEQLQDKVDLELVASAAARREPLRREGHTAMRVCNGAGDGVPGLWIDDFAGCWLVQTVGEKPPEGIKELAMMPNVRAVYWKRLARDVKSAPVMICGKDHEAEEALVVIENGLRFQIVMAAGYSQGLFLDQRANRAEVLRSVGGLRVLNTFAYTCGFGVAAAAGGAAEVVNIDLSRRALEWGRANYALNRLEVCGRDFIYGDVFDWLGRFARRGRFFDLIILDPPTFARGSQHGAFRVERDYGALAAAALRVLSPSGRLIAFANEHRLSLPAFASQMQKATKDTRFSILSATDRMGDDFPGSHYLKKITVGL